MQDPSPPSGAYRWPSPLRALAVVGLAVNAAVHLRLAPVFDQLGEQVTQGDLFRVEAAAAALAAALLLVSDRREAWLPAGLVSLAGLLAVVGTTFVAVPALGPLPRISDPTWSADKAGVVLATAATTTAWLVREARRRRS